MIIDGKIIDDFYVIAEIGSNHCGDLQKAKDLIKAAKECGADAVKFQKRNNKELFTEELYNMPYDNENSFGKTYGEHREALEFGTDEYRALQAYAQFLNITFFATAFDISSARFLYEIGVPAFKIASGDLQNIPLLKYVASFNRPVLISTGGGRLDDVQRAYESVIHINPEICLMQCTASYPAQVEEMNLNVIKTYQQYFPDAVIGLSDHQNGILMSVIGYMLGAKIIEKHFTLNHSWKGTDQAFSLEPVGLKKLVRDLHRIKIAMGDGLKTVYESELKPLHKMGKKLVANRDLPEGHIITSEDIAIKSPNNGLPPYMLERLIGKTLAEPIKKDENL